jgi:hypothetical protein
MRRLLPLLVVLSLLVAAPQPGGAEDPAEITAVAIGVTAGNALFLPIKVATLALGLATVPFAFIFSGGDGELPAQITENVVAPPHLITPAVARSAVGERPHPR